MIVRCTDGNILRWNGKVLEDYTSTYPIDDLVAYWPFEGGVNDATGNGFNATSGGLPSYVPGLIGLAASYYKTGSVNCRNDYFNTFFNTAFSISTWVKFPRNLFNGYHQIFMSNDYTISKGVEIHYTGECVDGSCSSSLTSIIAGYSLSTGLNIIGEGWNHIVLTMDASASNVEKLYLNNVLEASYTFLTKPDSTVTLGRVHVVPNWSLPTDQVRLYKKVLSVYEIGMLYNNGRGS